MIAVAWHPGAARAVAPVVIEATRRGWHTVMATSAAAAPIARRAGVERLQVLTGPGEVTAVLGQPQRPAIVVTGVSEGDTPEKELIVAARVAGLPSCAVLDNWGRYEERLIGTMGAQALPDVIAVMNDQARRAIVDAGFFDGRLVVTGQPGLDEFTRMAPIDANIQAATRRMLGLSTDREVVIFASQPLAQQFGRELGYDQYDAIALLAAALDRSSSLVVAVHPREDGVQLAARCPSGVTLVRDYDPRDLYAAASIVTSCFSAALTESVLAGRPAIGIQPCASSGIDLWILESGATFVARDADELAAALEQARTATRGALNQRRDLLAIPAGAADRVMQLAEDLAAASNQD